MSHQHRINVNIHRHSIYNPPTIQCRWLERDGMKNLPLSESEMEKFVNITDKKLEKARNSQFKL